MVGFVGQVQVKRHIIGLCEQNLRTGHFDAKFIGGIPRRVQIAAGCNNPQTEALRKAGSGRVRGVFGAAAKSLLTQKNCLRTHWGCASIPTIESILSTAFACHSDSDHPLSSRGKRHPPQAIYLALLFGQTIGICFSFKKGLRRPAACRSSRPIHQVGGLS